MALDDAGLRESEVVNHLIGQQVGILWIEPVVRRDENEVEHAILVFLQLIVGDNDGWMWLESAVGKEEADLDNVSLVIPHR